jgi:hypothetical protein
MTQVALQFGLHIRTVQKIWKRGKDSLAQGIVVNVDSRKRGRVGRKPREDIDKPIYIVQDNAPSHLQCDDHLFCEAAKQEGFDIQLICQPPNSPDFNILDLGFFRAIQAIQYTKIAKTV